MRDCKGAAAIVEEDLVLLRPMPTVGNDGIEVAITVDVPQRHAGRSIGPCAQHRIWMDREFACLSHGARR